MHTAHHTSFPTRCHTAMHKGWALVCLVALSCYCLPGFALTRSDLTLDTLAGTGWRIQALALEVTDVQPDYLAANLQITRLDITAFARPLRNLHLRCARLQLSDGGMHCMQGRLDSALPILTGLHADVSYRFNGDVDLRLDGPQLHLHFTTLAGRHQLELQTDGVDLRALQALSAYVGNWLAAWTFEGRGDIALNWAGGLPLINAHLRNFSYANGDGTQAGEKLDLALYMTPRQNAYHIAAALAQGDIYSDPLFVSHPGPVIEITTELGWQPGFYLAGLHYNHPGVGELDADLRMAQGKLQHFSIRSGELDLQQLYKRYLHAYFSDKHWPALAVGGTAHLDLEWGRSLGVQLRHVSIASRADKGFIVNGLNASVHWQDSAQTPAETVVSWLGARFPPAVSIGPGSLQASLHGQHLRLSAPLTLPILDGALHIETLAVDDAFSAQPAISFAGEVRPISMQAASHAFGWPELGGEISGKIPGLRYHDKLLQIDAALLLTVFGGTVIIHNLSLQNPLGDKPQLRGDVVLSELDLDLLTQFFAFGAITGHMSGQISKLHMIDWEPVAFDAFFHSADHETAPRKISQKAINNLSSLGGAGVTQALSRSVLRMFEQFSYSRLGWGCHLQHGLCQMRGIEANGNGYYLVKGGHLPPRIDVRGYNQRVDWDDLLRRLRSITAMGAPTIE